MKSMPKKAQTELLHAAEHGDYLLLCQILSKYSVADVLDYYGNTPLMLAARNGKTRTVKTLIEAGAYIHATNSDRENALILASREAHPRIVRLLLERGAQFEQSIGNRRALVMINTDENSNHIIDIIRAPYGHEWKPWVVMEKPTKLRIKRINRLMYDVIELLIVAGADVDIHDDENNTPLHIFIRCGDLDDCVRLLLKHNPYLNAVNSSGETPLTEAIWAANEEIALLLLDSGADPNIGESCLPIHLVANACLSGSTRTCCRLVFHAAQVF